MKTLGAPTAGQDMDSTSGQSFSAFVLGFFDVLQHIAFGLDDVIARFPLVTFSSLDSSPHGL